jgi:hypothetical protein
VSKDHKILVITGHKIVLSQSLLSIDKCVSGELCWLRKVCLYYQSVDSLGSHVGNERSFVRGNVIVVYIIDDLLRVHPVVRRLSELKVN